MCKHCNLCCIASVCCEYLYAAIGNFQTQVVNNNIKHNELTYLFDMLIKLTKVFAKYFSVYSTCRTSFKKNYMYIIRWAQIIILEINYVKYF